jgi:hypothetical protein
LLVSNTDGAILTLVCGVPDVPEYFSSNMSGNLRTITYFDYATLKKATRDFNQKNQLGRGGFGPVYLVRPFIFLWRNRDTSVPLAVADF